MIERAPCAALDCGSVLSVAEEAQLYRHYGVRDARDEVNADGRAGWAVMDRAQTIREGTTGQEHAVSRLQQVQPGR
ncbi:hypothetical protein ABZZ01_27845 [Streptomyces virginiae]|uniref:hypothetical protein n=1 Tax=Streptomyces virginiae TaxID=1961 RepID=UPI0033A48081